MKANVNNKAYSKDGLALTEGFEQCRLMPYQDSGGVWTNGWGNTHNVKPGIAITLERANFDLLANVCDAVDAVNDNVTVVLTQHEFDALVDFAFNVGVGAFKGSTLLKKLNAGDKSGAESQLAVWDKIKGVKSAGLERRRKAEQVLFEQEDSHGS